MGSARSSPAGTRGSGSRSRAGWRSAAPRSSSRQRGGGRAFDIVVANAGIAPTKYAVSAQGYEIAYAVNTLGLFCATQPNLGRGAYYHNTQGRMDLRSDDPASNGEKSRALWGQMETLARDFQ